MGATNYSSSDVSPKLGYYCHTPNVLTLIR